jgi:RNA polymerase sigma factor (sigma-70 family)
MARTNLDVEQIGSMVETGRSQDSKYEQAIATRGPALERLARAYEADPVTRRDLLQEIHIALWKSLEGFDNWCSLRTWVYRVAHNTAASHVSRRLRMKKQVFVGIEELAILRIGRKGRRRQGNAKRWAEFAS